MDPNRLAALMDGSLTGADRQAAIAEVAAFAHDDLGVFADAAAVLRELEDERAMTDEGNTGKQRRPDPPALVARKAEADRLRPHVARWVKVRGVKAVAERAELKPDSIRAFINRGVTPQPGALDAFKEMMWNDEWRQISSEIQSEDGGVKQ
jgi:hypothetical protein